jgi:5,10-methylenetetrahydromethanopterin reductase
VDYIRDAVGLVEKGAKKAGKTLEDCRPALNCWCVAFRMNTLNRPWQKPRKWQLIISRLEPHIMKARGVSTELLEKVQAIMGGRQQRKTTSKPVRLSR